MSARRAVSNARRLRSTIQRVEQQPYNGAPTRRPPRTPGGAAWCLFRLGSTLAAPSGTWPSLTPTTQANVACYRPSGGALVSLGNRTIQNWRNVSWSPSRTSFGVINDDGSVSIIDQDC